jgi:hypothetical protein
MISRRTFLSRVAASGLCSAVFGKAHAQDQQPQPRGQSVQNPGMLVMPTPYRDLLGAAVAMTPGDKDSIRALVEAMFKTPRFQMPEVMAAVVKQRLIDAQVAYFNGKNLGVTDRAVMDAMNALATAFETPDYGRVSLLQVQFVRGRLADLVPPLFKQVNPDLDVPMSPLEAMYLMAVLIQQKMDNEAYQVSPAEWDRDVYPRAVEQDRARKELQRRIASGEVQPKFELQGRVNLGDTFKGTLIFMLQKRIEAMSVMDGLKLFNDTFARLGIQ